MGQRQIHVVAAQHQMLTHGRASQHRQAAIGCSFDANQSQVGGATAHVHHQHQPALGQLLSQRIALQQQPVMKRRLGLFQQLHAGQTRQLRGLQRQCARTFVE